MSLASSPAEGAECWAMRQLKSLCFLKCIHMDMAIHTHVHYMYSVFTFSYTHTQLSPGGYKMGHKCKSLVSEWTDTSYIFMLQLSRLLMLFLPLQGQHVWPLGGPCLQYRASSQLCILQTFTVKNIFQIYAPAFGEYWFCNLMNCLIS